MIKIVVVLVFSFVGLMCMYMSNVELTYGSRLLSFVLLMLGMFVMACMIYTLLMIGYGDWSWRVL